MTAYMSSLMSAVCRDGGPVHGRPRKEDVGYDDDGDGPYGPPKLPRRDEVGGDVSGDMEPTDGGLLPPLPDCMLPPLAVRW